MTTSVSVIALDVGGTRLKGAVVDASGAIVAEIERETGVARGPDAVVATVLDTLDTLRNRPEAAHVRAAGLALPGIVDSAAGLAVWSENVRWRDVPFGALARERLGLPVAVGHDVRAGGLAEWTLGAARGYDHALVVPVGTGIAAALVLDGRIVDGRGMAGEIGHINVGYDEPCACGGTGCAEAVASAAALTRRYARRTGGAAIDAEEIVRRQRAGDPAAAEVWSDAVEALSRALAAACSLVAPDVVVLGGGLSRAGDDLVGPLTTALHARLTFQVKPVLVTAALGHRSGCLGAALLARRLADRVADGLADGAIDESPAGGAIGMTEGPAGRTSERPSAGLADGPAQGAVEPPVETPADRRTGRT